MNISEYTHEIEKEGKNQLLGKQGEGTLKLSLN